MTSAFRVDLHSLSSGGGYSLGVVVRLEIALDNGHVELGGKIRKRPFEQGSLSRAGGTDEVQGKNAVPKHSFRRADSFSLASRTLRITGISMR